MTGSDSQSRIYAGRSCYQRPLACWTHNPPISGSVDRAGVDDPSAAVTLAGPRCQPYGFGDPGLCRIASLSRSAITSAVPLYASAIPSRRRLCGGANCQWLARLIDQLYGERSAHVGQERRVTLTRPGRSLRGTSGRAVELVADHGHRNAQAARNKIVNLHTVHTLRTYRRHMPWFCSFQNVFRLPRRGGA